MSQRKEKRLEKAKQAGTKPSGRTHVLGVLAAGAVITVMGAEVTRVWRLGMLPRSRQINSEEDRKAKPLEALAVLREGYAVSRTRENSLFNMLASFTVAFGITRGITWTIRTKGGLMGFPHPGESEYDLFMTGHAGCSVSTASGLKFADFKVGYHEATLRDVPAPRHRNTPVELPADYATVADAVRRSLGSP